MPIRSLSETLAHMEQHHPGDLLHVSDPIAPHEGHHSALETHLTAHDRYPWLVFDNVRCLDGSRWPGLFTNCHANTYRKMAIAFGLDLGQSGPSDIIGRIQSGMRQPMAPEVIPGSAAPVRAVVVPGPEVRFDALPLFRNAELDSRPGWLCPIIIARDPDTGRYNYSWHRFSFNSPRNATLRFYAGRQLQDYWLKYRARKQPMPVALVIGHHSAYYTACSIPYPIDQDENDLVGGVYYAGTGQRMRLTPSETWGEDFLVPADAEMVIEGQVLDKYDYEGPFCDWYWTYAAQFYHPTFEPTALTRRERPIVEGVWPKTHVIYTPALMATIHEGLRANFPTVKAVNCLSCLVCIVSLKQTRPGQAKNLGLSLFQFGDAIKQVIVVDEDIDVYNLNEVFYALGTRVDTRRDVTMVSGMAANMDPKASGSVVGGMVIDATIPVGEPFPKTGVPAPEMMAWAASLIKPRDLSRIPVSSVGRW